MLVCRSQSPIRVQRASWSEAQIGPVCPLGVAPHAPELEHPEEPPPLPDPLLRVEDRPARGDEDQQRDDQEQRREQDQAEQRRRRRRPAAWRAVPIARARRGVGRARQLGAGRGGAPRGRASSVIQWTATSELVRWAIRGRSRWAGRPETATTTCVAPERSTSSSSRSSRRAPGPGRPGGGRPVAGRGAGPPDSEGGRRRRSRRPAGPPRGPGSGTRQPPAVAACPDDQEATRDRTARRAAAAGSIRGDCS